MNNFLSVFKFTYIIIVIVIIDNTFESTCFNITCTYTLGYMAQAHETGTSQVGGLKLAKVFYGRIV